MHARDRRLGALTVAVLAGLLGSAFLVAAAVTGSAAQVTDPTVEPAVGPAAVPAFAAAFSPATIAPDDVSTLTFTVDNRAIASDTTALSFTGELPAGVTLASQPTPATTCAGGAVTAVEGSTIITLADGTVAASGSCAVSVAVTAPSAGTYTATSSALTSSAGTTPAVTATLSVAASTSLAAESQQVQAAASSIKFTKAFNPTTITAGGTATLTFTLDNTANATETTGLGFTDTLPTTPGAMKVAATPNVQPGADCDAGIASALTATADAATITLANATVPASKSCTISVDVAVPATPTDGSYANTVDITPAQTADGTATATLTVGASAATTTTLVAPVTTVPLTPTAQPLALAGTGPSRTAILASAGFGLLALGALLLVASRRTLRRG